MNTVSIRQQKAALRSETARWQRAAAGLFAVSLAWNIAQEARISHLESVRRETAAQLRQAEDTRDYAIEQLGALSLQIRQDKPSAVPDDPEPEQPPAEPPMTYIGECTITAYCPCAECCGTWADGLTASGVPAGPGVVAVDPEIIPLGSTVVIDGQEYLAADTGSGVTGNHVDICMSSHEATVAFGVQSAEVWVVEP